MQESETFNVVSKVLSEIGDVPLEEIKPESNIIEDLSVDSLAFLDITFELDQHFDIKIPVETWMEEVNEGKISQEEIFSVGNLCARIDQLVTSKAA